MADPRPRRKTDVPASSDETTDNRGLGAVAWSISGHSPGEGEQPGVGRGGTSQSALSAEAAEPWHERVRRWLDVFLASAGLIIGAPLIALIAIAVKVDSRGPVLYRQIRIGRDRRHGRSDQGEHDRRRTADLGGRPFVIYKFRTMNQGAERGKGPVWASEEDDRITTIGRFLRRYRLDELPQLWNVLKGDMSLVGPRPERPQFVRELRDRIPEYRFRQRIRPGITGWAQVHQRADQTVDDVRRKVRYDLEYLHNRSLLLDLSIIARTPFVLVGELGGESDETSGDGETGGSGERLRNGGRHQDQERERGMNGDGGESDSGSDRWERQPPDRTLVLLATARKWLTAALEEVLSPEGFDVVHASDAAELEQRASEERAALVIVDEELPEMEVTETARTLIAKLGEDTPLLLYTSSSVAGGDRHADALRAGFWATLKEPVRAAPVVAELRRLLALSARLRWEDSAPRGAGGLAADEAHGFLTLEELGRVLPSIGALAERTETSVSLLLVGPTSGEEGPDSRTATASVFGRNVRRADLCAWIDDAEVAVVAYDTSAEGARALFERLNELAAERLGLEEGDVGRLSAGIVELKPSRSLARAVRRAGNPGEDGGVDLDRIVNLFHLTDARGALRDARDSGGGVRVIEIV